MSLDSERWRMHENTSAELALQDAGAAASVHAKLITMQHFSPNPAVNLPLAHANTFK